ncbi:hypothetical protein PV703_26695 [Streptomyces sp. ME01-24h]|nr:hypothetical protein [Streptomyces sp. ME19-03-3]MDX3356827.1 hypothetical protein [Streptomyces sp. ME01-24h]
MAAGALCAVGAYAGTVWVARSWQDCPLGNDASNSLGLNPLVHAAWFGMLLLLVPLGLVPRRWPLPGGDATARLALFAAVGALTPLYRAGMEWPSFPPDRSCTDGFPVFPFTGKTGPYDDGCPRPGRTEGRGWAVSQVRTARSHKVWRSRSARPGL